MNYFSEKDTSLSSILQFNTVQNHWTRQNKISTQLTPKELEYRRGLAIEFRQAIDEQLLGGLERS